MVKIISLKIAEKIKKIILYSETVNCCHFFFMHFFIELVLFFIAVILLMFSAMMFVAVFTLKVD